MAENKFSNLKSSLKQTADKIKSSESAEKIINSEAANKAKSALAETTEKIKNTDAYDKAISTVNDVTDKVANTEMGQKAKGVVDTAKSKNPKAGKLIKIGAIALIIVAVFGLFTNLFGEEARATKAYKESIIESYTSEQTKNVKVKVKCVAKAKVGGKHYYTFRTEITWEKLVNVDSLHWEKDSVKQVVETEYNTKSKKCDYSDYMTTKYNKYNDTAYKNAVKTAKDHYKSYKEIRKR